jgi:hypothetical protein
MSRHNGGRDGLDAERLARVSTGGDAGGFIAAFQTFNFNFTLIYKHRRAF